jgi:ABC-type enterochelin transport system permease subunit
MNYAPIILITLALATIIRIVFITLITISCAIAYAISTPILTTYICATISVGIGSVFATITSERVLTPATLAPMLITYAKPIIIDGEYLLTMLAYLDTI